VGVRFCGEKGGVCVRFSTGKGGVCVRFSEKGVMGVRLRVRERGRGRPVSGDAEEAVAGEAAAAVVGLDDEVSGGDEVGEDAPDLAAAQAGVALQGGLVGEPFAAGVCVGGDDEEEGEVRASFVRVVEDGAVVLVVQAHGDLFSSKAGRERGPGRRCFAVARRRPVRRRW
jgi:hypothetical protein